MGSIPVGAVGRNACLFFVNKQAFSLVIMLLIFLIQRECEGEGSAFIIALFQGKIAADAAGYIAR